MANTDPEQSTYPTLMHREEVANKAKAVENGLESVRMGTADTITALANIQRKIERGERLTEDDRKALHGAYTEVRCGLVGLLGSVDDVIRQGDSKRTQQCIDDFIDELLEDGELSVDTHAALTGGRCDQEVVFRATRRLTETTTVTVNIPRVLLDNDDLYSRFEDMLEEVRSMELNQTPECEDDFYTDSEICVG